MCPNNKKYDYIIVGAGFFGSIFAYELKKLGFKILVLEKRNHIGGNCYTNNKDNINIHQYGPHIFHTSNEEVWEWINQFVDFNNFTLRPVANYKGEIFSLPFNMWTFNKLWGVKTPDEAKEKIKQQSNNIKNPTNLEEQAIKLVGLDVYEKLIKGYTEKQWRKECKYLPPQIIKRLPVRFTYDNNYFDDKYQGIPIGGYTQIFEKLLNGVEIMLGVDYLKEKNKWDSITNKVVYTGPIDRYFNYKFGDLEYKTTKFVHKKINSENYQGCAMINYTDKETKYTRIIEHKHFEPLNNFKNISWISWEYPTKYDYKNSEPFYPVNDKKNNKKYNSYYSLSKKEKNVIFGGRLAEYKYYDMDKVIHSALNKIKEEIKSI